MFYDKSKIEYEYINLQNRCKKLKRDLATLPKHEIFILGIHEQYQLAQQELKSFIEKYGQHLGYIESIDSNIKLKINNIPTTLPENNSSPHHSYEHIYKLNAEIVNNEILFDSNTKPPDKCLSKISSGYDSTLDNLYDNNIQDNFNQFATCFYYPGESGVDSNPQKKNQLILKRIKTGGTKNKGISKSSKIKLKIAPISKPKREEVTIYKPAIKYISDNEMIKDYIINEPKLTLNPLSNKKSEDLYDIKIQDLLDEDIKLENGVEEYLLRFADIFIDEVGMKAQKFAELRNSKTMLVTDIEMAMLGCYKFSIPSVRRKRIFNNKSKEYLRLWKTIKRKKCKMYKKSKNLNLCFEGLKKYNIK
ncbi:Transcription initiation factor TFIID subunit 12 [Astathelohania contejeani]|uniref:Transcription initiation factor TFIID subunit 12 n=1 Tax=Astathelohania contejeani TaxID=164912 RepID=A0ABQ7HYW8_9MICR|nr:Transcription initiation factor TFIID subunit 12 [Thelohania contejeani]